jgi:ferredoxin
MASMATLAQDKPFVPACSGLHECGYCRCTILTGERWVREKIYEPLTEDAPRYLRYHADLFGDEALSCWEKHQMQQHVASV